MADEIAAINCKFLVKTSMYTNISQFDQDVADFWSTKDAVARIIKTVGGQFGERIYIVEPVKDKPKPKGEVKSKGVKIPKEEVHRMEKGGKKLPKGKTKSKKLSMGKGRMFKDYPKGKPKMGGKK